MTRQGRLAAGWSGLLVDTSQKSLSGGAKDDQDPPSVNFASAQANH